MIEQVILNFLGTYFFVGIFMSIWWLLLLFKQPDAPRFTLQELAIGLFTVALVWPALVAEAFDKEDRWRR